jgi:two-component system, sensor histidine kinase
MSAANGAQGRREPASTMQRIASSIGIALDRQLAERVANDQLKIVWSHTSVATLVATAFAFFLAARLSPEIPALYVQCWLGLKLTVAAVRVLTAQLYRHRGYPEGVNWRAWTFGLLCVDGFIWGLAGFVGAAEATSTASLVAASLAGVAAVATFGLQVRALAAAAYVVPMMLLTAAGLLFRADDFGLFGGIGLLTYLGVLLASASRSEKVMLETFLLREHSERIAAERQAALELAERHAIERQQALDHANRESAAKSQFLATMSHELRTPLHGILGVARLLLDDPHDAALHQKLTLIETSGQHLLVLINDLLDISRIEAGATVIHKTDFNLADEVRRISDVYVVRADDKKLQYKLNLAIDHSCVVNGDPARLRQILHNLLGNALKFTDVGQVSLDVSSLPGDEIVFEVKDTGIGISESDQGRIFEKFSQAETPGRSPLEGTGLGLTIARELARAMGGDVTCRSARGVGSCFKCTVPLPRAEPGAQSLLNVPAPAAASRPPRASTHILLAEDNEVNALVTTASLEREGARVALVKNGSEAVHSAILQGARPELIFMDVRMPVMDGLAATRKIRLEEKALGLNRVPIVALTATAGAEDKRKCIEAGMDDCLAKPCTRDELAAMMERWIDRSRHRLSSIAQPAEL